MMTRAAQSKAGRAGGVGEAEDLDRWGPGPTRPRAGAWPKRQADGKVSNKKEWVRVTRQSSAGGEK